MKTLNQTLHQTSHRSSLVRKAARLGLPDVESLIELAAHRGCTHYRNIMPSRVAQYPGQIDLSDNELVILLLHGNYRYEPMAVRCAAQLLKSSLIVARRVAFFAIQERCVIPLKYIASQGVDHDKDGQSHWSQILAELKDHPEHPIDGVFPHVSRFMINPGIQRGKMLPARWLQPVG